MACAAAKVVSSARVLKLSAEGFDCPARGSRIKAACGALRVGSAEN
jgi:hypothetical protein